MSFSYMQLGVLYSCLYDSKVTSFPTIQPYGLQPTTYNPYDISLIPLFTLNGYLATILLRIYLLSQSINYLLYS